MGEGTWRQMALLPPTLVHVRLDLGWAAVDREGMFAVEIRNPVTDELVAAEVVPLRSYPDLEAYLEHARTYQDALIREVLDPYPF